MTFDLLTIFGAGLLTFVTPCVLPVVPIYLAALVGGDLAQASGRKRGRLLVRASFFSSGFIFVFTLMGIGASSIGAFLSDHRTAVQLAGALLVLLFALKFLGVVRIPLLDRVAKADDGKFKTRFGWVNAFAMGVVFAAGWSPCVGPVLGSVLTFTASSASDAATGALYLSVYGFGFALPLLVMAAFAEAGTRLLRRVGPHLPKIEKAVGVLLLAVVGLLVHDAAVGWGDTASAQGSEAAGAAVTSDGEALTGEALPRLVEVYSRDCPICKRMKPMVDGLIEQCDRNGVRVHAIDVSRAENRHLVDEYRVVGVPTFVYFDEFEQEVARLVGEQTEGTLKQGLAALRGEECPGLGPVPPGPQTPVDEKGDAKAAAPGFEFPEQDEEEITACPSTSTPATVAEKNSKSSSGSEIETMFAAPSAASLRGSCSQDLL